MAETKVWLGLTPVGATRAVATLRLAFYGAGWALACHARMRSLQVPLALLLASSVAALLDSCQVTLSLLSYSSPAPDIHG